MININMNKAKDIWRNKIRQERQPVLEKLDIDYIKAIEEQNTITQQEIISKKQALRDAPADPRIENATDPATLKAIDPVSEIAS